MRSFWLLTGFEYKKLFQRGRGVERHPGRFHPLSRMKTIVKMDKSDRGKRPSTVFFYKFLINFTFCL